MGSDVSAVLYDVPRSSASFLDDVRRLDERVQTELHMDSALRVAWDAFYTLALAVVMRRSYPATPGSMV